MNIRFVARSAITLALASAYLLSPSISYAAGKAEVVPAPKAEDKAWVLPANPPAPAENVPNKERVSLGEKLFFEPRLSAKGNMSCASCHNPSLGWSDGLKTARGHDGKLLGRATPTVTNSAYNALQMWDGRKPTLEDQATGPMDSPDEMNTDYDSMLKFLSGNKEYLKLFEKAYPGEGVTKVSIAKAIASFERTVVVRNSPFDRWLAGDQKAVTTAQYRGFQLFKDKANCAACHSAPNFTDSGFHNIGLDQWGQQDADQGRFAIKKVAANKGAFKTPSLRDIESTAPYFHDGSAQTLEQVVDHYSKGGSVTTNLATNMKVLNLSDQEKQDLVAFLKALTPPKSEAKVPVLPN